MAREARQASEALHVSPVLVKKEKRAIHNIFRRRRIPTILVWLLILVVVAGAAYYFGQRRTSQNSSKAAAKAQEETEKVIAQVGKIMVLPQGESPTVATVSDVSKLQGQAFFKDGQNGDKILIYANSREAILYRPSINKIIKEAPLVMDQYSDNQADAANNPSTDNLPASPAADNAPVASSTIPDNPQPAGYSNTTNPAEALAVGSNSQNNTNPLNVFIDNGTKTAGAAKDTQDKLSGVSGINVIGTGDAKKNDYAGITVVDLTQKNTALVGQIAQAVGGQVGSLPSGEIKPANADVLIIVGK